jgi:DNA polymerase-3 subunit epsilon
MPNKVAKKPLIFLDTETTGLNPQEHEILEICLMTAEGEILFHSKIKPTHIETANPKALEVNGYSEEAWANAPIFAEVAVQLAKHLEWAIMAGHNISFDAAFIKAELERVNPELLKGIGYHLVDTVTLAYEHLAPCGLDSLSLGNVCKFLGVELTNAHTAAADTEACRQVYFKVSRSNWWNRLVWRLRNR